MSLLREGKLKLNKFIVYRNVLLCHQIFNKFNCCAYLDHCKNIIINFQKLYSSHTNYIFITIHICWMDNDIFWSLYVCIFGVIYFKIYWLRIFFEYTSKIYLQWHVLRYLCVIGIWKAYKLFIQSFRIDISRIKYAIR